MVLLLVSFVGGVLGTAVFGARADLGDLQRDVSIDGPTDRLVPGRIPFQVLERLGGDSGGEMTVAIAVSSAASSQLDCTFEDAEGADAGWSDSAFDEELLNARYSDYDVLGTARLGPGSYEAVCEVEGEPSQSSGVSFTVGRTFGVQDVSDILGPLLGILAVVVIAGLMFVVGLILLIVGLVQRSRARKTPPGGPYPPDAYPGSPYPPGSYPPGQYPGSPTAPGQYPGAQHPGGSTPPGQDPGDPHPQGSPGPVQWGGPSSPAPAPGQYPTPPAPPAPPAPHPGSSDGAPSWTGAPPQAPPSAPDPATDSDRHPDPDRTPDPGASGWTIPPSKQQ
jgi:hypothetical protein